MPILLVSFATFLSTMLGGTLALKLRKNLHLILGFSAGAVVAVAFFELLPEALQLTAESHTPATVTALAALGFFIYLLLDRVILLGHSHGHEADENHTHQEGTRGNVRAGSLSIHSFLDGVGMGLAFQVSPAVGLAVAAAVLAHDFSDGINTVNVVVRHGGSFKSALRWLLVDAIAPVVGVLVTMFFTVPISTLGLLLALFSGFFLYIGAADLIPESHHQHPKFLTTFMTLLGALVLYIVINLN